MSDFQSFGFSSYNNQDQSPLFSALPPEIRNHIYVYSLSKYEDFERPHSKDTYWWRPGDRAALRTATELLRTCRLIYNEAWLFQFALAEHCFYLTHAERSPGEAWPRGFKECNRLIRETYGKHHQTSGGSEFGLGRIRVFAQLWMLEPGKELQRILDVPHFHARQIAVTIRYSDFWFWESNTPLYIHADWVNTIRLPSSVTRFVVDFEMIERRKDEVNLITHEAAEKWFFERRDGSILTASAEDILVSRWTGSSVLGGARWVRDEVRPGQLDYHVVTVTWKLRQGATVCPPRPCPSLSLPHDFVQPFPPFTEVDWLDIDDLRDANATLDTPALEAWEAVQNISEGSDSDLGTDSEDDTD